MAAGAAIALVNPRMLVSSTAEIGDAVRVYAGYLVSRNLVLAAMLLGALLSRANATLHTLLIVVGFVQFADAVLDAFEGRWSIVPGVFILGCLLLLAASRVSRAAFWKREAWAPTN